MASDASSVARKLLVHAARDAIRKLEDAVEPHDPSYDEERQYSDLDDAGTWADEDASADPAAENGDVAVEPEREASASGRSERSRGTARSPRRPARSRKTAVGD